MGRADVDRLDRVPTRSERCIGLVLSALLALVFLSCAAFALFRAQTTEAHSTELAAFGGILAAIGLVGAFFFYRFAFTAPTAASTRAHGMYVAGAVAVSAALAIGTFLMHATAAKRASALTLLFVALAMAARARKK